MAKIQLSVSFTVAPAGPPPSPLVLTPAQANVNLTVGVATDGTKVAVVSGGSAPYTYALDPASGPLPTGVTFAEDAVGGITLLGTPTTAGASTTPVLLNITDSLGATAQLRPAFRTIG